MQPLLEVRLKGGPEAPTRARNALSVLQLGEACEDIVLLVSELVTNAAKHAFPDREGGLIRVDAFNCNGCWCFTVTDNGRGATGSLQGTGGRILEGLARSIRAQLYCQSDQCGTRVTIMLPALV